MARSTHKATSVVMVFLQVTKNGDLRKEKRKRVMPRSGTISMRTLEDRVTLNMMTWTESRLEVMKNKKRPTKKDQNTLTGTISNMDYFTMASLSKVRNLASKKPTLRERPGKL
jgi:hypothetical protein